MNISKIVTSSPEIMGGTYVLAGTRVPVQTLIDCLEAGDSIDDFLKGYPSVKRRQIIAFLEEAKNRMIREPDDVPRGEVRTTLFSSPASK